MTSNLASTEIADHALRLRKEASLAVSTYKNKQGTLYMDKWINGWKTHSLYQNLKSKSFQYLENLKKTL